jgi:NAD(P)H-hydrate repair Nnr-like enzyme with NAD(P)H-hydrate dehydratase domain
MYCFPEEWKLWSEDRRKDLGMGLGKDDLGLSELKDVLPRHRTHELVVDGTATRGQQKATLFFNGYHLRYRQGCHCHNLEGNCAP